MYVTYTRIYGWSDYGGESSYQPGYRLENMMWMTLLVYDYIIPGEIYSMNDKCVVLNAKKMNFDGKLDFSVLSSDVTVYDDTTEQQLSERCLLYTSDAADEL